MVALTLLLDFIIFQLIDFNILLIEMFSMIPPFQSNQGDHCPPRSI